MPRSGTTEQIERPARQEIMDLVQRTDVLDAIAALKPVEPWLLHRHLRPLSLPPLSEALDPKHFPRLQVLHEHEERILGRVVIDLAGRVRRSEDRVSHQPDGDTLG